MEKKILVGIEKRNKVEDGVITKTHTILHMLAEVGTSDGDIQGQKVFKENLWNIADVEKELTVMGAFEVGCYITVLYQGEGDFKKPTHIMCEKRK